MEEDDLLGGDLNHEQDLRRQLQHGGNFQGDGERAGFKGRRLENPPRGGRELIQDDREQNRFGGIVLSTKGGLNLAVLSNHKVTGIVISKGAGIRINKEVGIRINKGDGIEERFVVFLTNGRRTRVALAILIASAFDAWILATINLNAVMSLSAISARRKAIWQLIVRKWGARS